MVLTTYLLGLPVLLVGFLLMLKVPRRSVFELVHSSVWIFAITSFLSLEFVSSVAPNLLDGLVPYIPPVIPVSVFVAWSLHRVRKAQVTTAAKQ